MNTNLTSKIETDHAPKTVSFKIHVTGKASVPEVDTKDYIDFNGNARFFVQPYCKEGSKSAFQGQFGFQNTNGTKVGIKNLEKSLQKYADADIYSHTEVIKK